MQSGLMCLIVCYQSIDCLGGLYMKLNIPIVFTLFSKSVQLTVIANPNHFFEEL